MRAMKVFHLSVALCGVLFVPCAAFSWEGDQPAQLKPGITPGAASTAGGGAEVTNVSTVVPARVAQPESPASTAATTVNRPEVLQVQRQNKEYPC